MSIVSQAWLDAHPGALTQRKKPLGKGYAATPGTGPEGEKCKTCAHYTHNRGSEGRRRPYPKCAIMRPFWTNGPGTDIKASSPACRHWLTKEMK